MIAAWGRVRCIGRVYGRSTWITATLRRRPSLAWLSSHTPVDDGSRGNLLKVAILGPPNAGKTTLFNRLQETPNKLHSSKRRGRQQKSQPKTSIKHSRGQALVARIPGTTRDRREAIGRLGDVAFALVDTAGMATDPTLVASPFAEDQHSHMTQGMVEQSLEAAHQADVVLWVVDARQQTEWVWRETRQFVFGGGGPKRRRLDQPTLVVANKLEGDGWQRDDDVQDYLARLPSTSEDDLVAISALHGEGMGEIAAWLLRQADFLGKSVTLDESKTPSKDDGVVRMAILGRPNVGKSSILNGILQQDRVLVGPTPGLTRDAIAVSFTYQDQPLQVVDTAGIRKQKRQGSRDRSVADDSEEGGDDYLEALAVQDAYRAMKLAEVAVLVIDAGARVLQRHELAMAQAILQEGRAIVVAVNKMDLMVDNDSIDYDDEVDDAYTEEDLARDVREQLETRFPVLRRTPIVPLSALKDSESVASRLIPVVTKARERWSRTIPTGQLNRWLADVNRISSGHPSIKIKYILQTKGRPPTFLLFGNVSTLPDSYMRHLRRHFQDTFEMFGMEVRLLARKAENPYANKKKSRPNKDRSSLATSRRRSQRRKSKERYR